jgi:hypothetical protein
MAAAVTIGLTLCVWAAIGWAGTVNGTVLASEKTRVRLVLTAAPEPWMKKGAAVRILGGRGAILEVKEDSLWISTSKARKLAPGDAVPFEKARSTSGGC